jgi:hypothetical protein
MTYNSGVGQIFTFDVAPAGNHGSDFYFRLSWFLLRSSSTGSLEFNSITSCSRSPRRRAAGPGDLRLDAAAQVAVGAGDNVFLADDFSERDEWVFEAKKRFGMPPLLKPRATLDANAQV